MTSYKMLKTLLVKQFQIVLEKYGKVSWVNFVKDLVREWLRNFMTKLNLTKIVNQFVLSSSQSSSLTIYKMSNSLLVKTFQIVTENRGKFYNLMFFRFSSWWLRNFMMKVNLKEIVNQLWL